MIRFTISTDGNDVEFCILQSDHTIRTVAARCASCSDQPLDAEELVSMLATLQKANRAAEMLSVIYHPERLAELADEVADLLDPEAVFAREDQEDAEDMRAGLYIGPDADAILQMLEFGLTFYPDGLDGEIVRYVEAHRPRAA